MIMYGPGVEKIFDETKRIFPGKKINIFSSDYLKTKKFLTKIFMSRQKNLILGLFLLLIQQK